MKTLLKTFIFIFIFITSSYADSGNKWCLYTGMFDFSDDGNKSNLFGVKNINSEYGMTELMFKRLHETIEEFLTNLYSFE